MSQLYEIDSQGNKKIISGLVTGELPKYTMAEYTALTDKPTNWICTDYDATSEYGINATEVKYDSTKNVKEKIDSVNAKIQRKEFLNTSSISFSNIPQTCTGLLLIRGYSGNPTNWILVSFNIYAGTPAVDNNPLNLGSDSRYPTSASYSNGTLTFNLSASGNTFGLLIYSE